MIKEFYQEITKKISKDDILLNEPMSKHTSFHIGGNADIFINVTNIETLKYVLELNKKYNIPIYIIGNGSNILVKDKGIRGIVLKVNFQKLEIENSTITVGAGVKIPYLANKVANYSLSGLENFYGIPGTIGGLIRMNGGAYGSEIKDILISTTYMDYDGNLHTISNEEHNFSYRTSVFEKNIGIIIESKLQLSLGKKEEIEKKMNENLSSRKQKQPLEYPSAGSVFKRGDGFITAALIDKARIKRLSSWWCTNIYKTCRFYS